MAIKTTIAKKLKNVTRKSTAKKTKADGYAFESNLILRVEGLKKRYGKRMVVKGVSFQIAQGEVVGLLGPNGAGKTTSFYMTMGLVKQTEGKIFLGAHEITELPMYKRAREGIGYLAQEPSIFRKLTVRQNIESIFELRKLDKTEIKTRTDHLLKEFDITHVQGQFGMTLSGGERRRAEIARTLASDPKFILLDEPFAGVDPIAVREIQRIITHLKEKNLGILITDHNVRETLSITDRAYIMFDGEVLIEGTADKLIRDKKAKEIYLGEDFKL
ncbi:MAG: LPS export ABC transporter ATP-binding protein [Leptospirales bacterium]